jgi:hypothetical protein
MTVRARIPYELDDITLADATALIASCPSVVAILTDHDSPHSTYDSPAFIVTTNDPDALHVEIATVCNDDDFLASRDLDDSRVEILD